MPVPAEYEQATRGHYTCRGGPLWSPGSPTTPTWVARHSLLRGRSSLANQVIFRGYVALSCSAYHALSTCPLWRLSLGCRYLRPSFPLVQASNCPIMLEMLTLRHLHCFA